MSGGTTTERTTAQTLRSVLLALLVAVSIAAAAPAPTQAQTTITVDDDFESGEDTDGDTDFRTISAAVESAGPTDTVRVRDGTYVETVLVETEVTVEATGNATLRAPDNDSVPYTLAVGGDGVTVRGLTVVGADGENAVYVNSTTDTTVNGLALEDTEVVAGDDGRAVYVEPNDQSDLAFRGNLFTVREEADGEAVSARSLVSLSDTGTGVEVTNNSFENRPGASAEVGLALVSDGANVTANAFENSGGERNSGVGASVAASEGVTVADNRFVGNENGLVINDSTDVTVRGNAVLRSDVDGMQAVGSNDVTVESNRINDSGRHGVSLNDSADVVVTGNALAGNAETGVLVDDGSAPVTVRLNDFDGNGVGVQVRSDDSGQLPVVRYNDFADQGADLGNDGNGSLVATLNWFGVADERISSAAETTGDVIYDPFLSAPPESVETEPDTTQRFAHDLTLRAGDGAQVVAFPAETKGTVSEVFSDLPAGSMVMAWNASAQTFVTGPEMANESVGAMDAFIVTNLSRDVTVTFDYDETTNSGPAETQFESGYNLIGAPSKNDAEDAFAFATPSEEKVLLTYEAPGSQPRFADGTDAAGDEAPFSYTLDANDERTVNDPVVSPYTGYWVYVNERGDLPGNTVSSISAADEPLALNTEQSVDEVQQS